MTLDETIVAHRPELYRVALGLTRNADDAKDLVSDTIVRALTHRDKYEEGTRPVAWLVRVMRNLFYDGKRLMRSKSEVVPLGDFWDGRSVDAVQEFVLEAKQALSGLPRLTADQRVVLLAVMQGYTAEEVADRTGVPAGTVKSRLHRARRKLEENI